MAEVQVMGYDFLTNNQNREPMQNRTSELLVGCSPSRFFISEVAMGLVTVPKACAECYLYKEDDDFSLKVDEASEKHGWNCQVCFDLWMYGEKQRTNNREYYRKTHPHARHNKVGI